MRIFATFVGIHGLHAVYAEFVDCFVAVNVRMHEAFSEIEPDGYECDADGN